MSSFAVLFCFCLGLEEKHMDKTSFMISNQQMKAKDKLNMRSHIHLHTPSKECPGNIERRYERKNCLFRIDTNCTQSTYFMIDLCAISVYPSAENLNQKFSPKPLQTALNPHMQKTKTADTLIFGRKAHIGQIHIAIMSARRQHRQQISAEAQAESLQSFASPRSPKSSEPKWTVVYCGHDLSP